jgi:DNA repair exonuclease SbcCD ATPase subunit
VHWWRHHCQPIAENDAKKHRLQGERTSSQVVSKVELKVRVEMLESTIQSVVATLEPITFQSVSEARVEKLEARLEKSEARVEKLEARLEKSEARVEKLEARLDKLAATTP